jgi:hypothetical protein
MRNLPASRDQGAKRQSTMAKIWAILNRDISSFKTMGAKSSPNERDVEKTEVPVLESTPPEVAEPAVKSEVNSRQIDRLRFRREVMNWRDGYHFAVTLEANRASTVLSDMVKKKLDESSVLGRFFSKSASDILAWQIESCVESALARTRQEEEAALRKRLLQWFPDRPVPSIYPFIWPKLEWDTRLTLKFKSSNLIQIQAALNDLILGDKGLAAMHRDWATRFANQLLEMRNVESDSV